MAKAMVWGGVVFAVIVRLACALMGAQIRLGRRVEVVTPVTSLMRLAEGQWFKQVGLSPYAGSAYHGSPLLLALLGPITSKGSGQPDMKLITSVLVFVAADLIGAKLLRALGDLVESARLHYMAALKLEERSEKNAVANKLSLGDVAALAYLMNPFTIAVCVGGTTSPIENMVVIVALYGAAKGNAPLGAFGWAFATHLSMYPAVLIIPISLLMVYGPDRPPKKLFNGISSSNMPSHGKASKVSLQADVQERQSNETGGVRWVALRDFLLWSGIWWICIINLCSLALGGHEHLKEMLSETYGFILSVEDLSPNLGLFWYFFTEVFTHFLSFFIMVFHANILFVIVPLTIRLHHRPLFLAFLMTAISTMLKSYPSVGDAALSLGLMVLFGPEMSGFRFSFLIFNGYLLIAALSPSMYNLWIWRGTGNANFYFAMALVYATIQSILIVESVGTIIRHDRGLKILTEKRQVKVVDEAVQKESVS